MSAEDGSLSRDEAIRLALDTFGGNTIRYEMLVRAAREPIAASQFAAGRGGVGRLSYHVQALVAQKYLRKHHQEQRRGAIMTFYALTKKGRKLLEDLGADASS